MFMTEIPASSRDDIFVKPASFCFLRYIFANSGIRIASAIPSTKILPLEKNKAVFVASSHLLRNFKADLSIPHSISGVIEISSFVLDKTEQI